MKNIIAELIESQVIAEESQLIINGEDKEQTIALTEHGRRYKIYSMVWLDANSHLHFSLCPGFKPANIPNMVVGHHQRPTRALYLACATGTRVSGHQHAQR